MIVTIATGIGERRMVEVDTAVDRAHDDALAAAGALARGGVAFPDPGCPDPRRTGVGGELEIVVADQVPNGGIGRHQRRLAIAQQDAHPVDGGLIAVDRPQRPPDALPERRQMVRSALRQVGSVAQARDTGGVQLDLAARPRRGRGQAGHTPRIGGQRRLGEDHQVGAGASGGRGDRPIGRPEPKQSQDR